MKNISTILSEFDKQYISLHKTNSERQKSEIKSFLSTSLNSILDGLKMEKKPFIDKSPRFVNNVDMWGEEYADLDAEKARMYNQAVEELTKKLSDLRK